MAGRILRPATEGLALHWELGDIAGARSEAQSALTLAARLAAEDPANALWQFTSIQPR